MNNFSLYIKKKYKKGESIDEIIESLENDGWSKIKASVAVHKAVGDRRKYVERPAISYPLWIGLSALIFFSIIYLMNIFIKDDYPEYDSCVDIDSYECALNPTDLTLYTFLTVPVLLIFIPLLIYQIMTRDYDKALIKNLFFFLVTLSLIYIPLIIDYL